MNSSSSSFRLTFRDRRRHLVNGIFRGLLALSGLFVLLPLLLIFAYVVFKGAPALNAAFFVEAPKPVGEIGGGIGNALAGSALLVGLAALVGVPIGILVGIYLSEFGRGWFAHTVHFCVDLLVSVPSILVGLFVSAVVVIPMKSFSAYAGALSLVVIMVPMVARVTESILNRVPNHIREAGLALGVPRWKVILRIVLKAGRGGILTGVVLALARISGETAPLLFTAFNHRSFSWSLSEPVASVPVQIYNYAISPFEEWHQQAWAAALVLIVFVFILNLLTRVLAGKTSPTKEF